MTVTEAARSLPPYSIARDSLSSPPPESREPVIVTPALDSPPLEEMVSPLSFRPEAQRVTSFSS